jgi:hypothetical protein
MGLPVEVNSLMMGSLGGYNISRSLRFRSSASAYLNRTPASAGNRKTWTWSGWVKRGTLGSNVCILGAGASAAEYTEFLFQNSGVLQLYVITSSTNRIVLSSSAVFRDPSAWYHVVLAVDTTQATNSNGVKIYVNGVQQTLSFTTYTQNVDTAINNTVVQNIGQVISSEYFDGYFAEVNHIDGQQLTPSSFGSYDTNGVWQPKKYTGTYGTNGFYLPFNWSSSTSYAGSFNGSTQYLTVPTNTAFDMGAGNFTVEAWVLTDATTNRNIVAREYTGNGSGYTTFVFSTTQLVASTSGSNWEVNFTWSLPSANQWHHYALVRNGNVYSVYIDGIRVGTQTVAGTLINGFGSALTIGYRNGQSLPSGSLSNVRIVKGTAVYTANFTPPTSALTAISGTSLLTLQNATIIDNSTNNFTITNVGSVAMSASSPFGSSVTADASGNNNGWASNNINYSAYGTTFDSMIDSPTVGPLASNYATWNPIFPFGNQTFTNGNLSVATGTSGGAISTISVLSGKWYWEVSPTTIGTASARVAGLVQSITAPTNLLSKSVYLQADGKYSINNGAAVTYGGAITTSDIVGVALDVDAQTVTFYKNGSAMGSAISISSVYTAGDLVVPAIIQSGATNNAQAINFGQRPFSYTPPTGFNALNTYNLPAPSIANGAQYMAATTYTGNGSTQTITNGGNNTIGTTFQPDLVWVKSRTSGTYFHELHDVLRTAPYAIYSNSTNAEQNIGTITSFNSNGFGVSTNSGVYLGTNDNAGSYIGWQWKAGGTGVTNTAGTITSTVSASPSSGFSIATYTGTGANATVGHGLGVAPAFYITKSRSSYTNSNWCVYHQSQGATAYGILNSTSQFGTTSTIWNNTEPTSTVFSLGSSLQTNNSGLGFVAYCFAAVSGYSAFGSYTGNGSTDGPFIYTGFRPRWVMFKVTSTTENWYIIDSSRNVYNVSGNQLKANTSDAEDSYSIVDFTANGFKIRNTFASYNSNGATYVYAAFAENPLKWSRAR